MSLCFLYKETKIKIRDGPDPIQYHFRADNYSIFISDIRLTMLIHATNPYYVFVGPPRGSNAAVSIAAM